MGLNGFHIDKYPVSRTVEKMKTLKTGPNWPNRQCCLAGSSKRAPRILIFSIAMGAEYLSHVKSIATFAPTFYGYTISVLASVTCF